MIILLLQEIHIVQFRNLLELQTRFNSPFICFTGKNGSGKTNILDAIWYLCTGKSYFNFMDSQNINYEEKYFTLKGKFLVHAQEREVFVGVARQRKKVIKEDDVQVEKISRHYGKFPSVIITPYDVSLIHGGSEERRRFIDSVISLMDEQYLQWLIQYERVLAQRNAHLKDMALKNQKKSSLMEIYNEELSLTGDNIFKVRKSFHGEFIPVFHEFYSILSKDEEKVGLRYNSQLTEKNMKQILSEQHEQDLLYQRTTAGVHKDDLELEISAYPIKKFGSQGQQKSFLIALKLAEYQFVKERKKISPLLLLDDIFDRLDENRVANLMEAINHLQPKQVFITDTSPERVEKIISPFQPSIQVFGVKNGSIVA